VADELTTLVFGALMPGVSTHVPEPWVAAAVANGLESVCLFFEAVGSPEQIRTSTSALHALSADLLIAVDEESGEVTRVEASRGSSFLSPLALGAIGDAEVTRASGRLVGRLLRDVGIDWDLAPVADVNVDPRNPVIGVRSFGTDPRLVAEHSVAFIDGLQTMGVPACAKHFPGHGDTHVDSHEELPVVDASRDVLEVRELSPFRSAIATGVASIMTGHLLAPAMDPNTSASLSPQITTSLLREELGFGGVVVTDAVDMGAVSGPGRSWLGGATVAALRAGADLVCLGAEDQEMALATCVEAVHKAVADGRLDVASLRAAATRRDRMRTARMASATDADSDERVVAHAAIRSLTVSGDATLRHSDVDVVRIVADPGYAAGETGWGVTRPLGTAGYDVAEIGVDDVAGVPGDRELVVEVRDVWKSPRLMYQLAELVTNRPDAVIVDVGWPAAPLPEARGWITTRGTGRLSSALAACVLGGTDPVATALSILSTAHLENP
jgi:beta-N-acetylhexosaminidase